jgi:hypothetical protein
MSSRYITVGLSEFAINQHYKDGSFNSYTSHSPKELERLVIENWDRRIPGAGETTIERKVLVPVQPEGFYCPPRAQLQPGMQIKAEIQRRQEGEDPYIETFVEEAEARRVGAFVERPATTVNVVCYSAEALEENGGKRTTTDPWEIVTILASDGDQEPMAPLTLARNYLQKAGGTFTDYTAQQFAESIWFHSTRKGIKVRLGGK